MKNQTDTKQTAKKRNNKRAVEEQVEVAPRSRRTNPALLSTSALRTRVDITPLCQDQSFVSGENQFLLLRPIYETRVWGAGAQKETPQDPPPRNSAPSRGWGRSSFTYTFYLGSRSPHKEYHISIYVIGVVLWAVFACYVHLSGSADSLPLALVSHC